MKKTLYTKRGDMGTTTRYGSSVRMPKTHTLFEALGTLDELNSFLGLAKMTISFDPLVHRVLHDLQHGLFSIQAEVAGADTRLPEEALTRLEAHISSAEVRLDPRGFILPGATVDAAYLDVARTIARRAERAVLRARGARLSAPARAFLNRSSSALYALARYVVECAHVVEEHPQYHVSR